ncbi:hypothetical protein ACEPPN_015415 [Leptodophora sp. 'Broadleaf-Isolate-01']
MIVTTGEDHKDTDNTAEGSHERSTIEYLAPKVHVNIRRQVLDESGHSREAVLEALKSQNTDPRSQKEEEYQEEEDRLPKLTSRVIACLNIREIADCVLKDALSKSIELTGEFTDEYEFEKLI